MTTCKSPAFQFYPKDFIGDPKVAAMPMDVRGMYISLLCYDWIEDGFLASEMHILAQCDPDGSAMAQLSRCFIRHPKKSGHLTNPRIQKERDLQLQHRSERSESGKKGAKARWINNLGDMATPDKKDGSAIAQPCFQNGTAMILPMAKNGSSSSSSSSSINLSKDRDSIRVVEGGMGGDPHAHASQPQPAEATDPQRCLTASPTGLASPAPEPIQKKSHTEKKSKAIGPRSTEGKTLHGKFVWLSDIELEAFVATHGKPFIDRCIAKLDAWIETDPIPKKIKNGRNASACFRSWVLNAVAEEQSRSERSKKLPSNNFKTRAEKFADEQEALRIRLVERDRLEKEALKNGKGSTSTSLDLVLLPVAPSGHK